MAICLLQNKCLNDKFYPNFSVDNEEKMCKSLNTYSKKVLLIFMKIKRHRKLVPVFDIAYCVQKSSLSFSLVTSFIHSLEYTMTVRLITK